MQAQTTTTPAAHDFEQFAYECLSVLLLRLSVTERRLLNAVLAAQVNGFWWKELTPIGKQEASRELQAGRVLLSKARKKAHKRGRQGRPSYAKHQVGRKYAA